MLHFRRSDRYDLLIRQSYKTHITVCGTKIKEKENTEYKHLLYIVGRKYFAFSRSRSFLIAMAKILHSIVHDKEKASVSTAWR
jgi:hypothetical protein